MFVCDIGGVLMKKIIIILLWLTIFLCSCTAPVGAPVQEAPEQEVTMPQQPAEPKAVPVPKEEKETLKDVLETLQASDISFVEQNLDRGTALDTQTVVKALNRVSQIADAAAEPVDCIWYANVILKEERLYDRCIVLKAGIREKTVEISLGKEQLCIQDEELYWMVRRNQNVQPLGIDWEAYDRFCPYVDACLKPEWEVPPETMAQIRLELVGFQRVHTNDAIGAELYEIEIVANAASVEAARYCCAGGAFIDSGLRVHGIGAYKYLVVIDGEPVGYGDWSIFYGHEDQGRFEEKFPTKEALTAYLSPLPEVHPEPDMGVRAIRILEQLRNFEIALVDQFLFEDVSQLEEAKLFLLFLLQSDYEELERQYDPVSGQFYFPEEQIRGPAYRSILPALNLKLRSMSTMIRRRIPSLCRWLPASAATETCVWQTGVLKMD